MSKTDTVLVMDQPEGADKTSLQNHVRTEAAEHVEQIQDHEVAAFEVRHATQCSILRLRRLCTIVCFGANIVISCADLSGQNALGLPLLGSAGGAIQASNSRCKTWGSARAACKHFCVAQIRITGPGKTRNYIAYATGLLMVRSPPLLVVPEIVRSHSHVASWHA